MATVYLVCDLSGSMLESGKRFIVRNLVRTVDQYYRLQKNHPEIKLVAWSNDAVIAKWEPAQEVPDAIITCSGTTSGENLVKKLEPFADGFFMFFTDGYWQSATTKAIGGWSRSLPQGHLRIVKVGEDADPRLKGPSVFEAEDLLAALRNWAV